MRRAAKGFLIGLAALVGLACSLLAYVIQTSLRVEEVQAAPVACSAGAPRLRPGQPIKVMSWNVQYLAGKRYVFWYDKPDDSGPDLRPSLEGVSRTLAEVARVIAAEDPDVVLLQEVNDGARSTDYDDQLARILAALEGRWRCSTSAFYLRGGFVPHPKILGSTGLELAVMSKYEISSATRYQLPRQPQSWLMRHIGFKRAILEARLPREDGSELAALTTHLDAWAAGGDTMQRQVAKVMSVVDGLTREGVPWVLGGDFNLLPPGASYGRLVAEERAYYNPRSELAPMFERYTAAPSLAEIDGPDSAAWLTYFPNGVPGLTRPDRVIDFLFLPGTVRLGAHYVRQADTLQISDHEPVVAVIEAP